MHLASVHRLCFYLTLGWSVFALAMADSFFLRWMPLFAIIVIGLIAISWRHEGRWEMSESTANHLALVIALSCFGWILIKLPRTDADLIASEIPWPAGLLPHLAPVVMVLILAKLYRPKRRSDYWVFQAMALISMILASVLTGEAIFLGWLTGYLVLVIASLACAYRMSRLDPNNDPTGALFSRSSRALVVKPWRGMATWASMCLVGGMGIYLMLPRFGSGQWSPTKLIVTGRLAPAKTGVSGDSAMDLNRSGRIELSNEVAFEVAARDMYGKVVDLPSGIYWRMDVLDFVRKGQWFSVSDAMRLEKLTTLNVHTAPMRANWDPPLGGNVAPPSMEPGQAYLRFHVYAATIGGLPLAEPIDLDLGAGGYPNVGNVRRELFYALKGSDTIQPVHTPRRMLKHEYGQLIRIARDTHRHPADVDPEYLQYLLDQTVPSALPEFTKKILLQSSEGSSIHWNEDEKIAEADHEKAAQTLNRYLAISGEYKYSLDRPRSEKRMDPTMDFLVNVKEGHCERFSAALALMLRSQGIPSRIVRGFAGAEREEDSDVHIIRQSRAHSWVQAYVKNPATGNGEWLLLDPTPGGDATQIGFHGILGWIAANLDPKLLWHMLFVDYNADSQGNMWLTLLHKIWDSIRQHPVAWGSALAGIVGAASVWRSRLAIWTFLTRLRIPSTAHESSNVKAGQRFVDRFRHLASRWGIAALPGQTPAELAQKLSERWQSQLPKFAEAPLSLIDRYYGIRFGSASGSIQQLLTELDRLEAAAPLSSS
ncbi:MAG: DUF3488 and transglutaminase-like domain-containing protein [Gemmataceae bacterium]